MSSTPSTVPAAFTSLDATISLDPTERVRAEKRHGEITEVLVDAQLATSTFLQGSFARKTMRKPLKDVDIVVLLPSSFAPELQPPYGPGKALDLFKQPLRQAFRPQVSFDVHDRPGKALQVVFSDCPFTFDLVAAFPDTDNGEDIFIANRDEQRWERSNTRRLKRIIAERNQATSGRFVHQVRMVKEFKAHHEELDVCGLVIESLAYGAIAKSNPHAGAVAATLRHAESAVIGPVLDPTGVDDLSARWTAQQRSAFSLIFAHAAQQAEEALRLEADGSHAAAIEIWHAVLGEDFPVASAQSEMDALRLLASGSVTSMGRATSSDRGAQPMRPARAWRSR